jgi:hypothetical protein
MDSSKLINKTFAKIEDIVASPKISGYIFGYSKFPASNRESAYKSEKFSAIIVLADGLSQDGALDLEEALWNKIKISNKSKTVYRKSHDKIKHTSYRRSVGGVAKNENEKIFLVYLAWF